MQSNILVKLLNQTWSSPVFGDSFDDNVNSELVFEQINQIAGGAQSNLTNIISHGMPDAGADHVVEIVSQIIPKTVSFCPALTAGEVADTSKLQAVATAIGIMYWGDQTVDRGDEAMKYAIKMLGGQKPEIPAKIKELAYARFTALQQIEVYVKQFAQPEDVEIVLDCFIGQVLVNEVRLNELSQEYLKTDQKDDFITANAAEIAKLMVVDAGFPSVSSSLYAIYRGQDKDLVDLKQIYADTQIATLLQICNAVVRAADELGDYKMDSGDDPEWGIFVINLFNQANERFIKDFLALSKIDPTAEIMDAFLNFKNDPNKNGAYLMNVFFGHVKKYLHDLSPQSAQKHKTYIKLCKRVLEIGKVNELGDIALSGK